MLNGTFYVSVATQEFIPATLDELYRFSSEKNAHAGITGFLVHLDGRFFQYIEGLPEATSRLMTSIERDPRHEVLRCVSAWALTERQFPVWSMQHLADGDATNLGVRSIMFSPALVQKAYAHHQDVEAMIFHNWDRIARNAVSIFARLKSRDARPTRGAG